MNMFKPEVPEAQNHGRRLLKHVQTGKQNMLDLTERAKGFLRLRIVLRLLKGLSASKLRNLTSVIHVS